MERKITDDLENTVRKMPCVPLNMNILPGLDGLKNLAPGSILSIGNFDGVHRGHQGAARPWPRRRCVKSRPGARLAVVTFEPHPLTALRPDKVPPRLTPRDLKRELIEQQGVDDLVELAPEPAVLNLSAEQFWAILRDEVKPLRIWSKAVNSTSAKAAGETSPACANGPPPAPSACTWSAKSRCRCSICAWCRSAARSSAG